MLKQIILGNTVFKAPELPEQYRSTAPIVTCECFSMIPMHISRGWCLPVTAKPSFIELVYTLGVQSRAQISSYCLLTQNIGVMCAQEKLTSYLDRFCGLGLSCHFHSTSGVLNTVCFISLHFASEIKHNLRLENSTCRHGNEAHVSTSV